MLITGGKSLCYQLPALLSQPPGSSSSSGTAITLVISPLLSLIQVPLPESAELSASRPCASHLHAVVHLSSKPDCFACGPQDQTLGLIALGIQGTALTSLTSKDEVAAIYKRLNDPDGDIRLLYGAPLGQHLVFHWNNTKSVPITWRVQFPASAFLDSLVFACSVHCPWEHVCYEQGVAQFSGRIGA